ncbi:MAG: carbonic anhydrase family protein [Geminicoccaceae bacterium]|nr:carbonic anhydrase family protein [Geminicoccaceae bacterium]
MTRSGLAALLALPLLSGCGSTLRATDAAWAEFTRPAPPEHVFKAPAYALVPAEGGAPQRVALVPVPSAPAASPGDLAALPTAATAPARPLPPRPMLAPVAHGGPAGDGHGPAPAKAEEHHGDQPPHWAYAGRGGPEEWGGLDPAFGACAAGRKQSPIDLTRAETTDLLPAIAFYYQPVPLKLRNNGHTIQADVPAGNWIEIAGTRYELRQFHLHAPSEHLIDGRAAPMEVHLVHENAHGQLAVVGVMVENGAAADDTLDLVLRHAPRAEGVRTVAEVTIDPRRLLPADRDDYRYVGSLTTPPCSEGVAWHVMKSPIKAATNTLAGLAAIMPNHNARPVQPLNGRALVLK